MTGFGPSVRSISTFGTRNGFTFPTQAAGSLATIPVGSLRRPEPPLARIEALRELERAEASVVGPLGEHR